MKEEKFLIILGVIAGGCGTILLLFFDYLPVGIFQIFPQQVVRVLAFLAAFTPIVILIGVRKKK